MNATARRSSPSSFMLIPTLLLFFLASKNGKAAYDSPLWLHVPELVEQQQQHTLEHRPGMAAPANNQNMLSSQVRGAASPFEESASKHNVAGAAGKVFNFLEKMAVQVGAGVKNTVLHHFTEARSSALVKKAKFLVAPPVTEQSVVEKKLNQIGTGTLNYSNRISHIPPDRRAKAVNLANAAVDKLRKISRKYTFLKGLPHPEQCYKSVRALQRLMEDFLENPYAYGSTPAFASASLATSMRLSIENETQKILDIFYEQTKYMLLCLSHILANEHVISTELRPFAEKMLPAWKSAFVLAWRLSCMLEHHAALTSKRILAEFVDDTLTFDSGLLTAAASIGPSVLDYDPRTEYYYCTPVDAPFEQVTLGEPVALQTL